METKVRNNKMTSLTGFFLLSSSKSTSMLRFNFIYFYFYFCTLKLSVKHITLIGCFILKVKFSANKLQYKNVFQSIWIDFVMLRNSEADSQPQFRIRRTYQLWNLSLNILVEIISHPHKWNLSSVYFNKWVSFVSHKSPPKSVYKSFTYPSLFA